MNIRIKYNDVVDEFTNDKTLEERLENYINKKFHIAYTISNLCQIYLMGGGIRDLICAKHPKDLDFVVLGKENTDYLIEIFNKYNVTYSTNKLGGFKFNYNDIEIDLWLTDDLFSSIQYNVDGIFFDLQKNSLVSLTFADFLNNGLKLINNENNIENGREEKLKTFENKFRDNIKL